MVLYWNQEDKNTMKVVFKTDDVGYTHVHNLGTFKATDDGVVSHHDIMLDCGEGSAEAYLYIKDHPWISTGWHTHFWGWPVLDPKEIPHMVNEKGRFIGRSNRWDTLVRDEVPYEEVYKEAKAQMDRCIKIMGRTPDTMFFHGKGIPWDQAIADVALEYELLHGFCGELDENGEVTGQDEKYRNTKIVRADNKGIRNEYYTREMMGAFTYDPYTCWEKYFDEDKVNSDVTYICTYHAGYLDELVQSESSLAMGRVKDTEFLSSDWLKQWLVDHKVAVINMRDAALGTNEYQNHLKAIGSPLYIK